MSEHAIANPNPNITPPWVLRWESPRVAHPVIVALRERREAILRGDIEGTEWGVLQENVPVHPMTGTVICNEPVFLCRQESQVEVEGRGTTFYGRWLTEEEYSAKAMEEMAKPPATDEPADQPEEVG